ncbi:unnamed protein product [Discula destructiva]
MSSSPALRVSRYPRATPPPSSTDAYSDASVIGLLSPDHSERSHDQKLADAKARHDQIRNKANQILLLHEQQLAQSELLEQTRLNAERLKIAEQNAKLSQAQIEAEQKRIKAEEAARLQEQKARELAAKTIPPLPPIQKPTQQPAAIKPAAASTPAPLSNPPTQPAAQTTTNGTASEKVAPTPVDAASIAPKTTSALPTSAATVTKPAPIPAPAEDGRRERALHIHRNLKGLRKDVEAQTGSNRALKACAGDLRRELRKCVGQLSLEKKGNSAVMLKVSTVLKEGLGNQAGSSMIDPSHFIFENRKPVDGATHNDQMPSLFLFLINHLAKCVIKQFVNECSANTKTADPIGVLVASIFSDPLFHWRGKPLIDILMAKFHVVCPVLFGAKGLEKSEQGRDKIGWLRRGPDAWIPELEHYDRQIGLAAGYAAIALRDFSRSKKTNPWPMHHYWESFAQIVNTQPSELSNTQCVVLKAMIEHHEQRFLQFYGNAAVAALRLALVDFPANAKSSGLGTSGVDQLAVHAKTLKSKYGLVLA